MWTPPASTRGGVCVPSPDPVCGLPVCRVGRPDLWSSVHGVTLGSCVHFGSQLTVYEQKGFTQTTVLKRVHLSTSGEPVDKASIQRDWGVPGNQNVKGAVLGALALLKKALFVLKNHQCLALKHTRHLYRIYPQPAVLSHPHGL